MGCQREPGPKVESRLFIGSVTLSSPYLSHLNVYREDNGAGAWGTQSYLFSPDVLPRKGSPKLMREQGCSCSNQACT